MHVQDDKFHSVVAGERLLGHRRIVLHEILLEFVTVMVRRMPSRKLKDLLGRLAEGPTEIRGGAGLTDVATWCARADEAYQSLRAIGHGPLSLQDLILLGTSQRLREPILTFDEGIIAAVKARLFPGALLA